MREGSLDAPERHPLSWTEEEFYDEARLDEEHAEAARQETIACMEDPFDDALPSLRSSPSAGSPPSSGPRTLSCARARLSESWVHCRFSGSALQWLLGSGGAGSR